MTQKTFWDLGFMLLPDQSFKGPFQGKAKHSLSLAHCFLSGCFGIDTWSCWANGRVPRASLVTRVPLQGIEATPGELVADNIWGPSTSSYKVTSQGVQSILTFLQLPQNAFSCASLQLSVCDALEFVVQSSVATNR